ncbi:MAG: DUF6263 family protein [Planctomycetales bacterium]
MSQACLAFKWIAAVMLLWGADEAAPQTPAASGTQTYTLAYKFTDQQLLHYTQHQNSEIESSYDGMAEKVTNRSDIKKHLRITKVLPDGSAELELVIDSVVMHAQVGDEAPEDFDSNSKEEVDRPDFKKIQENIGKPQGLLHFSPTGKLLSVMKGSNRPDDYQTLLISLPGKPVAIGETWKEEFKTRVTVDVKLSEEVSLKRSYTLDKVDGGIAHIRTSTYVLTPSRSAGVEVQLSQKKVHGTILFDMERGVILSRDLKAEGEVANAFGAKTKFVARMTNTEKLVEAPVVTPTAGQK